MAQPKQVDPPADVPPGRPVELPGRGVTFVRELPGPPGAPTVILLHGLAATGGINFASSFAPLAEHFRVVALDHRGHGRGVRSGRHFTLEDCADDVVALADVLGLDRFIPVGYSMGGPIAQLVWRRHPHRVDGLVLCATSRSFRDHWHERLRFASLGLFVAGLRFAPRRAVLELGEGVPQELAAVKDRRWALGELRRHDPRSILEATEALGRFSSRRWIGQVQVPVSVVVMAGDRVVPVARQAKLALAIPTAVLHVVAGSHLACSSAPQEFADTLVDACLQVHHRVAKAPVDGARVA